MALLGSLINIDSAVLLISFSELESEEKFMTSNFFKKLIAFIISDSFPISNFNRRQRSSKKVRRI